VTVHTHTRLCVPPRQVVIVTTIIYSIGRGSAWRRRGDWQVELVTIVTWNDDDDNDDDDNNDNDGAAAAADNDDDDNDGGAAADNDDDYSDDNDVMMIMMIMIMLMMIMLMILQLIFLTHQCWLQTLQAHQHTIS